MEFIKTLVNPPSDNNWKTKKSSGKQKNLKQRSKTLLMDGEMVLSNDPNKNNQFKPRNSQSEDRLDKALLILKKRRHYKKTLTKEQKDSLQARIQDRGLDSSSNREKDHVMKGMKRSKTLTREQKDSLHARIYVMKGMKRSKTLTRKQKDSLHARPHVMKEMKRSKTLTREQKDSLQTQTRDLNSSSQQGRVQVMKWVKQPITLIIDKNRFSAGTA